METAKILLAVAMFAALLSVPCFTRDKPASVRIEVSKGAYVVWSVLYVGLELYGPASDSIARGHQVVDAVYLHAMLAVVTGFIWFAKVIGDRWISILLAVALGWSAAHGAVASIHWILP